MERWTQRAKTALAGLAQRHSLASAERTFRLEAFGAIRQLSWPRALVFIDRTRARHLGITPTDDNPIWANPAADGNIDHQPLRAPLEAHLQLTNRCDAGCQGCYTAATPSGGSRELDLEGWKRALDELARMGVFHLALGGGESAVLPWLGEIADYARSLGMIPNLTTSGLTHVTELIEIAPLFGQINVSIDGLGDTYRKVRGFDGFAKADQAISRLRKVQRNVGINVVVCRRNFDELDTLFAYARAKRLNEIELLRFKPSGRGSRQFARLTCTDDQHRRLLPRILRATRRHRVRVRVDCSYVPMLAHHKPSVALLRSLAVYGCTGGDFLIGAKATGQLSACSFARTPHNAPTVDQLGDYWDQPGAFGAFRSWSAPQEPCASCEYHSLCRGGCRVVSAHVAGSDRVPDPECPRVVDTKRLHGDREGRQHRVRLPVAD